MTETATHPNRGRRRQTIQRKRQPVEPVALELRGASACKKSAVLTYMKMLERRQLSERSRHGRQRVVLQLASAEMGGERRKPRTYVEELECSELTNLTRQVGELVVAKLAVANDSQS